MLVQTDVTKEADCEVAVQKTLKHFDKLDILVCIPSIPQILITVNRNSSPQKFNIFTVLYSEYCTNCTKNTLLFIQLTLRIKLLNSTLICIIDTNLLNFILQVNNAGIGFRDTLETCATGKYAFQKTDEHFAAYSHIMDVNVKGALMLSHYAAPHLIESRGAIVNMSSISSLRAVLSLSLLRA